MFAWIASTFWLHFASHLHNQFWAPQAYAFCADVYFLFCSYFREVSFPPWDHGAPSRLTSVVSRHSHSHSHRHAVSSLAKLGVRVSSLETETPHSKWWQHPPIPPPPANSWCGGNNKLSRVRGVFLMWFDICEAAGKRAAARDLQVISKLNARGLNNFLSNLPNWIKLRLKRNLLRFCELLAATCQLLLSSLVTKFLHLARTAD